MNRLILPLVSSLLCGGTLAADLNFSATSVPSARIGVSGLDLGGFDVGLGVSNFGADVSVARRLDLSALGTLSAGTTVFVGFGGGVAVRSTAGGTLGPFAVNARLNVFNTPLTLLDPLSAFDLEPTSTASQGVLGSASARYRVSRDLVVTASGEFGRQPSAALVGEWRRDDLNLRLGARAGQGVAGALIGATLRGETVTLGVDGLIGPNSLGAVGSVSAVDVLGENTSLRAYLAYEPWRTDAAALRYGADATLPVGPGDLTAGLRGGLGSVGARVSYRLPLGEEGDAEE